MTNEQADAPAGPELIHKTACDVVALLRTGAVSPLELLDALEERVPAVEPAVHALGETSS